MWGTGSCNSVFRGLLVISWTKTTRALFDTTAEDRLIVGMYEQVNYHPIFIPSSTKTASIAVSLEN
jgi:hypothetical protein